MWGYKLAKKNSLEKDNKDLYTLDSARRAVSPCFKFLC